MYEWISDKEVSWVMEYIDGKPISSLKFTDNHSLDQILRIMIQVCNGLIALHSRNIIHRDLKPENILISSEGIVKITDFDFIKTGFSEKKLGKFIGTPEYSSPEHFISSYEMDTRSDLYSLGVILYELLTRELPFAGKNAKEIGDSHRLKPLVLPTKINPEIPKGVEKIIIGLLEKEPKDRYQHAHTVAKDILKEIEDKKGIKLKSNVSYLLKPKFVNRITPLKTLNELSEKLKNKNGKVVLILGESGIGKSKLVQQFFYHLQLQDIGFYKSICKTVEPSFNPLHKIFKNILSDKSLTEKKECFGEFGWDLVKFGILPKQDWMKKIKKPAALTGQNAEIRLFGAITDFLKKAATKPLVICIDDLHWADEQILKWLQYAERNLKGFPVLIIGLHRSEQLFEDSKLLKIENLIQIKIKNLKDIDVSEMIISMLGSKRKSKELNNFIENIVSHTNGNPLFIREMLYYLNEKEMISIVNNKWEFPEKLEPEKLPDTIQNVIQTRLHELSTSAFKTLQIASVIGKKFSFDMLLNLTQKQENELLDDLIDCREVSLLEESDNDFLFIHDKFREVLESELKGKDLSYWKELHQQAGEFLEDKYSENIDEVLDNLANHFYLAEQHEKSVKYNELAGDQAKKNFLNSKTLKYFDRLISNINNQLKNCTTKDTVYKSAMEKLFDTMLKKGKVLIHIGKWNESEKVFIEVLKIAQEIKDNKKIALTLGSIGNLFRMKGEFNKAMGYFEKQLKIGYEIEDKELISTALGSMGNSFFAKGDYAHALKHSKKSLKISQEINKRELISKAFSNLGNIYHDQGNFKKAIESGQKSLIINQEIGNKIGVSYALGNLGLSYFYTRDYEKATNHFKKNLKISQEIGDKTSISISFRNLGFIYGVKCNYKKAIEYFEKSLSISEELGVKRLISEAVGNLGIIYSDRCEFDKALEYHQRDLRISEEMDDKTGISEATGNLGRVHLRMCNFKEALKCCEKTVKIDREIGLKMHLAYFLFVEAECLYELNRIGKAIKNIEECLEMGKEMKNNVIIFNCTLLQKKIEFKANKDPELQIKKGIEPLEKILNNTSNKEKIARLNYVLAIMNNELNRENIADRHKKKALELFMELYKKTPNIEFKNRIEKLGKLT
jgi:predicted ATPase